jgi:hypothetical protein
MIRRLYFDYPHDRHDHSLVWSVRFTLTLMSYEKKSEELSNPNKSRSEANETNRVISEDINGFCGLYLIFI